MASTYEKVIGTISQPPDIRKDFEVNNLLPWFRKKSDLFRNLKTDLLFDLIKYLQFVNKKRDDIIIKQGEQGDCMYILLRGQVTIYIMYNKSDDDDKSSSVPTTTGDTRKELGTYVCSLGPGATFGEVALLSDDCIRTASIIVDENSDLIVIDRELYNRSVKSVLKKEFEDKSNFINDHPTFQTWAPKYKKQLAMALQKEIFPYDGIICKQGDPVASICFILSGEVKLVMDPLQHKMQYPKYFPICEGNRENGKLPNDEGVDELLKVVANRGQEGGGRPNHRRKKSIKKQPQEVCLLGVNESVGDIEVLLGLDTCLQTAICSQRTEVLVLEMKHFERLIVKRNPKTVEAMKEGLELKINSRINKHLDKSVPLMRKLLCKAEDYNRQRQAQNDARQGNPSETRPLKPVKPKKTMSEIYESFVPTQGALVDIHGPGTVFHRIRQREEARVLRQHKGRRVFGRGSRGHSLGQADDALSMSEQNGSEHSKSDGGSVKMDLDSQFFIDQETSDPALSSLEDRMRSWLAGDNKTRTPTRVAKLHRTQTEPEVLKPGAKVVLRPRVPHHLQQQQQAQQESEIASDEENEKVIINGYSWAPSHIQTYGTQQSG